MNLFSIALQIHIAGAVLMAILLLITVGLLMRNANHSTAYKAVAVALAFTAGFEVVTGSSMYLLAEDSSLLAFCGKMAIYLSLTAVAEYALIRKLRAVALENI